MAKKGMGKYEKWLRLGSDTRSTRHYPIGPLSLHRAIGHAEGIQSGRIVQLLGNPSSGKSTLALDAIAQTQRRFEEPVLYIDFERTFSPEYSQACGVDLDRLIVATPDTTEQGFNILEEGLKDGLWKLVVVDSFPAAKPSAENEKDFDDSAPMAGNARILTRMCTRIIPILDNQQALLIGINQFRANFGLSGKRQPWGGVALMYATSLRIDLTHMGAEGSKQKIMATVEKNKVGAPKKTTELVIDYGSGFNHAADSFRLALEYGIITQAGAWYAYEDVKAQGIDKALDMFPIQTIHEQVLQKVREEVDG